MWTEIVSGKLGSLHGVSYLVRDVFSAMLVGGHSTRWLLLTALVFGLVPDASRGWSHDGGTNQ